MRYYMTCLAHTGEKVLIMVKGKDEIDAVITLNKLYRFRTLLTIDTTVPKKNRNYYASTAGVHDSGPIQRRPAGRMTGYAG